MMWHYTRMISIAGSDGVMHICGSRKGRYPTARTVLQPGKPLHGQGVPARSTRTSSRGRRVEKLGRRQQPSTVTTPFDGP
jgi:hypothetical protein